MKQGLRGTRAEMRLGHHVRFPFFWRVEENTRVNKWKVGGHCLTTISQFERFHDPLEFSSVHGLCVLDIRNDVVPALSEASLPTILSVNGEHLLRRE